MWSASAGVEMSFLPVVGNWVSSGTIPSGHF